ncbi:MAG: hypothetical protein IIZ39_03870, partial [Blautia sp.]|nr:hypothetical protein [Blautia sp.]
MADELELELKKELGLVDEAGEVLPTPEVPKAPTLTLTLEPDAPQTESTEPVAAVAAAAVAAEAPQIDQAELEARERAEKAQSDMEAVAKEI